MEIRKKLCNSLISFVQVGCPVDNEMLAFGMENENDLFDELGWEIS